MCSCMILFQLYKVAMLVKKLAFLIKQLIYDTILLYFFIFLTCVPEQVIFSVS